MSSRLHPGLPLLAILLLASCVAPKAVQAPPPETVPVIAIAPPPAQDWTDGPLTPGAWRYAADGAGSMAAYGLAGQPPLFVIRCSATDIGVTRTGATQLTVTTTSIARTLAPAADGAVHLPVRDAFLDAMTFSRGRMMVQAGALPVLVLPVQAEIGRVVEDCRG